VKPSCLRIDVPLSLPLFLAYGSSEALK